MASAQKKTVLAPARPGPTAGRRKKDAPVEVLAVTTERAPLGYEGPAGAEIREALNAIAPGLTRLPLAKATVTVEVRGVSVAVANGLRRAMVDEIPGLHLDFGRAEFDRARTTDAHMSDDFFIRRRINLIPLRPMITQRIVRDASFALHVENATTAVLTVYAGDLVLTGGALAEPIFNPTHEIAFLQPQKSLHITEIRLVSGFGYTDASFNVAARASSIPLDIPELPRSETHEPGGSAVNLSGYAVGAGVADPRHFRIVAVIPAAPDNPAASIAVAADACANIQQRLMLVLSILKLFRAAAVDGRQPAGSQFVTAPAADRGTQGTLTIRGETPTIGQILARAIHDLHPGISYVSAPARSPEQKQQQKMVLEVVAATESPSELADIVIGAAQHAHEVFGQILAGVRARSL